MTLDYFFIIYFILSVIYLHYYHTALHLPTYSTIYNNSFHYPPPGRTKITRKISRSELEQKHSGTTTRYPEVCFGRSHDFDARSYRWFECDIKIWDCMYHTYTGTGKYKLQY